MPNQPPLNPDALEAGAKVLFMRERKYHTPSIECPEPPNWEDLTETSMEHYRGNARAVLAVAQPEVNSVEQLKKLPKGTIIKEFPDEHYGNVFRKIGDNEWQETGTPFDYADAGIKLPAIVLYPTEGIN